MEPCPSSIQESESSNLVSDYSSILLKYIIYIGGGPKIPRMRVYSLWLLSLFVAVISVCVIAEDQKTFEVVGIGECADCKENNFKTSQAFQGLHVTIDCKLKNGEIKRVGDTELDKDGNFKLSLPKELLENEQKLKEECYAQLHSAAAAPCPAHNGLEDSKIVPKTQSNGKLIFGPAQNLKFSTSLCTSKFLWPYFKYPPLPPHPWKKTFPKFPLPPPKSFGHPWTFPPLPPLYKPYKPLPPPLPIYKPPVVKPLPPPVPIYKPPVPVYKPPLFKPLPPPVPVYKPPVFKPLPPPVPIYKPPKPLPPPFYKKPCPPLPLKPFFHQPKFGPLPPFIPQHP